MQSDFHPLMGDEEEFRLEATDDGVKVVFRTHDGEERPVVVPMRGQTAQKKAA